MKKTPIKRNHRFGIRYRYNFGEYKPGLMRIFNNEESAQEWLYTETYEDAERELISRTRAIKMFGKKIIEAVEEDAKRYGDYN